MRDWSTGWLVIAPIVSHGSAYQHPMRNMNLLNICAVI
jgi:hypothetical protein